MKCNKPGCADTRADLRELKIAHARLKERYWKKMSFKECGYCEKDMEGHWPRCYLNMEKQLKFV